MRNTYLLVFIRKYIRTDMIQTKFSILVQTFRGFGTCRDFLDDKVMHKDELG